MYSKSTRQFLNELGNAVIFLGADRNGHKMKLDVNLYLGLIAESFSELSSYLKSRVVTREPL